MTSVSPVPSPAHEAAGVSACNVYPGPSDSGGDNEKGPGIGAQPQCLALSASAAASAAGLVSTSTSDTLPSQERLIDGRAARLHRMRRAVVTSARLHQDGLPSGFRAAMITLTYARGQDWHPRQVSFLLQRCRQWLARRRRRLRYAWVLELTKAGRPHFHVVLWLPRSIRLPKPDRAGWWPWGSTRIEWARRAVGYLAKYASKGQDTHYPKGVRIHGAGGFSEAARLERAWWLAPAWVRERCTPEERPQRARGGGWVLRLSGEWFPPRYRVEWVAGGWLRLIPLHVCHG
jgi:hypothetical protein